MTGVEIDFVVRDSLEALALYQSIFEVMVIEATQLSTGLNEVIFTLYDTRFHLLDENPTYGLLAPKEGETKSLWFNVVVPDIEETYAKAIKVGCVSQQPVTAVEELGVSNAVFSDPFGYLWMLHQIHREVSFEKRMTFLEETTPEKPEVEG